MKQYKDSPYYIDKNGKIFRKWKNNYKIRKTQISDGYERVDLQWNDNFETKLVHRLVAELYIDNLDNKTQVNHINGISTDNNVNNLEWVTPQENILHALRILGRKEKYYNSRSKLNKEEIQEIKEKHKESNFSQKTLSEKFNISRHEIGFIIKYELWEHIK